MIRLAQETPVPVLVAVPPGLMSAIRTGRIDGAGSITIP